MFEVMIKSIPGWIGDPSAVIPRKIFPKILLEKFWTDFCRNEGDNYKKEINRIPA